MSAAAIPPDPTAATQKSVAEQGGIGLDVCTPEHCHYAFDTLYCSLTKAEPISPTFSDDK